MTNTMRGCLAAALTFLAVACGGETTSLLDKGRPSTPKSEAVDGATTNDAPSATSPKMPTLPAVSEDDEKEEPEVEDPIKDPMEPPPVQMRCTTPTDAVTASYKLALLRDPDGPGLSYWVLQVQSGTPRLEVLEHFLGSAEFLDARKSLSDTRFVTSLYMGFFGRAPEQAGLDFWMQALQNGSSRTEVAVSFVRSAEFADPKVNPKHACFF